MTVKIPQFVVSTGSAVFYTAGPFFMHKYDLALLKTANIAFAN
jgi:hypothetical protein